MTRRRLGWVAAAVLAAAAKVTLTGSGNLDPAASFFTAGPALKLVYASSPAVGKASERLGGVATVIDAGDPPSLPGILADLAARGVRCSR